MLASENFTRLEAQVSDWMPQDLLPHIERRKEVPCAEIQTSISNADLRLLQCVFCDEVLSSPNDLAPHQKAHGYVCHQCKCRFTSHESVSDHARDTCHDAYRCLDCDARFSRLDVLRRHRLQHVSTSTKYSCTHCKKWRAPNGFARKDHLTQHLRNFHHIEAEGQFYYSSVDPLNPAFHAYCLREDCPMFLPPADRLCSRPIFPSRSAFTTHMRREHDESMFPCTKPGCSRIGGKGFFRKRGLLKHVMKEHPVEAEDDVEEVASGTQFDTETTDFSSPWLTF